MKKYHEWHVCIGCFILLFCTMGVGINGYAIFHPYIVDELMLSNTQGSLLINFRNAACILAMLLTDKFFSYLGLRKGCAVAVLATAGSFLLYALSDGFIVLLLGSLLEGFAYGFGGLIPVTILIQSWFRQHQGLALGIASIGSSVAAIFLPVPLMRLMEVVGIRWGLLACMLSMLICLLLVLALIREPPQCLESMLSPVSTTLGKNAKTISPFAHGSLTLLCVLIGFSSNVAYNHFSIFFANRGTSSFLISQLLTLLGVSMAAGKILFGRLFDCLGLRYINRLFSFVIITGFLILCFTKVKAGAYCSMLLIGISMPYHVLLPSILTNSLTFTGEASGTLKKFQIFRMAGAVLLGWIPGTLADHTGDYTATFLITAIGSAISCFILELILYRTEYSHRR